MQIAILVIVAFIIAMISNGAAAVGLAIIPVILLILGICMIVAGVSGYDKRLDDEYEEYVGRKKGEASVQRSKVLMKEEQTEQEMKKIRVPVWFNQDKYYSAVYSFTTKSPVHAFFEAPESYLTEKEFSHILLELWKKYPDNAEVKEYVKKWKFLIQERRGELIDGKYRKISNVNYINEYCVPFKHKYAYVEPSPTSIESKEEFERHSEARMEKWGNIGTAMILFGFAILSIIIIVAICS